MAEGRDFHELETKLGYKFINPSFLLCALSHTSYANEQRSRGISAESNERLEFLGDAVLETVISDHLFKTFEKRREGSLTKLRQQLVCEKTLAVIASELDLGSFLNIGHGEELTDCRRRPKIIADCLEAIIAAIYLDIGRGTNDELSEIIIGLFNKKIEEFANSQATDYKTMLQQLAEQDGSSDLSYVIKQSGELHKPQFEATAIINNNAVGFGCAKTKKGAEMAAAKQALKLFGIVE